MTTELTAEKAADNSHSHRMLKASFTLSTPGTDETEQIGYLMGDIVDRIAIGINGGPAYIQEILGKKYNGRERYLAAGGFNDSVQDDVGGALRKLYNAEGDTRARFADFDELLQTDQVAHIAEFEVYTMRGQGLGSLCLEGFNEAVMRSAIGFRGPVVLTPRSVDPDIEEDDEEEEEKGLTVFYEKNGYRLMYAEEGVAGSRVMSRTLP